MRRVVKPEILDSLPPSDPAAQRSRRDLRRINALMGNGKWMEGALDLHPCRGVVEIGAGEGCLCRRLAARFPDRHFTGLDLLPAPGGLPANMSWMSRDLRENWEEETEADAVIGVMILHHFTEFELAELGKKLKRFRLVCLSEPWRNWWTLGWGMTLYPFVGSVTRHDMLASIRAGFEAGEMARLLCLEDWKWEEHCDSRGAIRLMAWRP